MAHALYWNDIDLSGATYGLTVLKGDLPAMPAPRVSVTDIPFGYGGLALHAGYAPKRFAVPVLIEAASGFDDLQAQVDALNALLCTGAAGKLAFDKWPDRYWMAYPEQAITAQYYGTDVLKATLYFVAPDPRAYGATERSVSGLTGAFQIDTRGQGSAHADPIWTITNAGSTVRLVHETTGEVFQYTDPGGVSVPWIQIDSRQDRQVCSRSVDGEPVLAGVTGVFPRLVPGTVNKFYLQTGTAAATWYDRYL